MRRWRKPMRSQGTSRMVFAWLPKLTQEGCWVWLERVERQYVETWSNWAGNDGRFEYHLPSK